MGSAAVFEEEATLPCTKEEVALLEGNGLGGAGEGHADMTGHIIGSFEGVGEVAVVFGDHAIEELFEIMACAGVGIFHEEEATTGVAAKDSEQTVLERSLVQGGL